MCCKKKEIFLEKIMYFYYYYIIIMTIMDIFLVQFDLNRKIKNARAVHMVSPVGFVNLEGPYGSKGSRNQVMIL